MSDQIPGEVLVPQTRFIPKCDHDDPHAYAAIVYRGDEANVNIEVRCGECHVEFERELPYAPDGVTPER